jgi:glycosyltransferase involved in cell wall biosynthesis
MTKVAVLIPCLNEEATIDKVVKDFREQLPEAEIHVFDNASTDATRHVALEAGAVVHTEPRRGKGHVVQSMFRTVEADVYVMVDGDDTYPAEHVHELIREVESGRADMAVGSRLLARESSFRTLNRLGNHFFLQTINVLFGTRLTDVLSGYRAMSRAFVKGLPLLVTGFEVEVELTIKALERGFRIAERPTPLRDRPQGSHSKLRKVRDGWRILSTIFALLRDYRPRFVFGGLGLVLLVLGLLPGQTGLASAALLEAGALALAVGFVLHGVNRRVRELECVTRLQLAGGRTGRKRRQRTQAAAAPGLEDSPGALLPSPKGLQTRLP